MSLEVNKTDSIGSKPVQAQEQAQGQQQQQTVIVNVHTGEKSQKGKKPTGSIHSQAKPATKTERHNVNNSQTIGSNNNTYGGDNITVTGNGNMTTGRIESSTVAVGNNNNVTQNKQAENDAVKPDPTPDPTPNPEPPKISREDAQAGKTLALRLHSETSSSFANNGNISNVFGSVNERNAYSFFKEYISLADGDNLWETTGAMHDSYDVFDTFNNINVKITTPAIEALLKQADSIGLSESDEFNTLDTLNSLAKQKQDGIKAQIRTPDLSNNEAVSMDKAIKSLIDQMSQVYKPR